VRYLEELGDLAPAWREGEGLPTALWMVVGALRRSLDPQAERDREMVPALSVKARSGRWLTLQAALTQAAPGRRSQKNDRHGIHRTEADSLAKSGRLWAQLS
jgi:hypothetical protein